MAVAIDMVGTFATTGGGLGTTLDNDSITVGADSNRALVVVLCFDGQGATGITVQWDSLGTPQNMVSRLDVNTTGAFGRITIWTLINPTAGNKRLAATWTNSVDAALDGICFTGVDQTDGTTSFPHANSATGTSASASVTITSATGNYTVNAVSDDSAALSAPTQTQMFIDGSPGSGAEAGSYAAGAASVVFGWTVGSGAAKWVDGGIDVVASGGGGPAATLMGQACL